MIPLGVLCDHCANTLSLGPDGEQSIIDFWDRHSLAINRDHALDRMLMSIQCDPVSVTGLQEQASSTRLIESFRSYGSCASFDVIYSNESTELVRSSRSVARPQANIHEFFFRAHHVISLLHQSVFLRGSLVMKQNQHLVELLNGFSYEAVRNLTEPQINDLLSLLVQIEGLIGQLGSVSGGASSLYEMRKLTHYGSMYGTFASMIVSLLSMLVGGAYAYSMCRGFEENCLKPELGIIFAGAGIVFFVSLCLIFRKFCDPLTKKKKARASIHEV